MTKNTSMTTRFRWSRFVLPVVVGTAMMAADGAAAGEREHEKLPGYVDVSGFAELADEDSELVEVSIHGPLLKVLARAGGAQQAGLDAVFAGIQSISAVIVEDTGQMDRAKKKMRKIADQLKENGWERIALVREASQMVLVYVHVDDEEGEESIDGLVVMVKEGNGEGQLVVVNIAGRLDLSQIGRLGGVIQIPGLQKVPREKVPHVVVKRRGTSEEEEEEEEEEEDEEDEDDDW